MERALRVADEDDAAAVVVVAQVVAPGGADVAVRALAIGGLGALHEPGQRDLAVDGGEDPARARVARGLVAGDRADLGIDLARGRRGRGWSLTVG